MCNFDNKIMVQKICINKIFIQQGRIQLIKEVTVKTFQIKFRILKKKSHNFHLNINQQKLFSKLIIIIIINKNVS